MLPLYQELAASYGLTSRIAGWRALESAAAYQPGTDLELDRIIVTRRPNTTRPIRPPSMRILLINANTSPGVTDKLLTGARAAAAPGTDVVAVTGTFGARVIGTRSEHAIAEHSSLALAACHAAGCDAVVIAVSYDTGARAVRELLPVPVVGMTEAALLTASAGRAHLRVRAARPVRLTD